MQTLASTIKEVQIFARTNYSDFFYRTGWETSNNYKVCNDLSFTCFEHVQSFEKECLHCTNIEILI